MADREGTTAIGKAVYEELNSTLASRRAVVSIVGLGYVGLPLAAAFGNAGFRCIGIDLDSAKLDVLANGCSYLPDVSSEAITRLTRGGLLSASADFHTLSGADAIIICVPTPIYRDKRPDLSDVLSAGEAVGRALRRGQLVVLESTCYPGTTEDILGPLLQKCSGLEPGKDFWLAFSPERIDPGNTHFPVTSIPKVVGGICPISTELASTLYSHIVPNVIEVSSPREAEMCKLIENTFRHVNIALANELAIVSERLGIDFWEAIAAAASKPFGFMPFYPGPGVGGHCIPVDPHYLVWKARECEIPLRLTEAAEQINAAMPAMVVERIVDAVNRRGLSMRRAHILLLGVSYKRGVGDVRESPALRIMELLKQKGAEVTYHDPHVLQVKWNGNVLCSRPLTAEMLSSQDCVVLVTDHDYDYQLVMEHSPLLIDTRNALNGHSFDETSKIQARNYVRLWGRNGLNHKSVGRLKIIYDHDVAIGSCLEQAPYLEAKTSSPEAVTTDQGGADIEVYMP